MELGKYFFVFGLLLKNNIPIQEWKSNFYKLRHKLKYKFY